MLFLLLLQLVEESETSCSYIGRNKNLTCIILVNATLLNCCPNFRAEMQLRVDGIPCGKVYELEPKYYRTPVADLDFNSLYPCIMSRRHNMEKSRKRFLHQSGIPSNPLSWLSRLVQILSMDNSPQLLPLYVSCLVVWRLPRMDKATLLALLIIS